MSCPHSNAPHASPDNCSRCRQEQGDGSFSVHQVRVSDDGVLMVDGQARGRLSEINRERQEQEEYAISRTTRR